MALRTLRPVKSVRPGGWIDVAGVGTGRVASVWCVPGTTRVNITLEGGWTFQIGLGDSVRYWDR